MSLRAEARRFFLQPTAALCTVRVSRMRIPVVSSFSFPPVVRFMSSALAAICVVGVAGGGNLIQSAEARPMDPSLSRLVENPECHQDRSGWPCRPNQADFHRLVSQWGAVLAPGTHGGARPLGLRDLELSMSTSLTDISSRADYWQLGSEGSDAAEERNFNPATLLVNYSANIHRGFGFGLQLSGSVGFMPGTEAAIWGLDIRQGLLEGLRPWVSSYVPDISMGLGVRKVTGWGDMSLFTQSIDLRASRGIVLAAKHQLTGWFGLQWLRIVGDSELVDFTPAVDAVAECGYVAPLPTAANNEGLTASSASDCPGSGEDRANTARFNSSHVLRYRAQVGVDYRQDSLVLGLQLATDLLAPGSAQSSTAVQDALRCAGADSLCEAARRQWALNLEVGLLF